MDFRGGIGIPYHIDEIQLLVGLADCLGAVQECAVQIPGEREALQVFVVGFDGDRAGLASGRGQVEYLAFEPGSLGSVADAEIGGDQRIFVIDQGALTVSGEDADSGGSGRRIRERDACVLIGRGKQIREIETARGQRSASHHDSSCACDLLVIDSQDHGSRTRRGIARDLDGDCNSNLRVRFAAPEDSHSLRAVDGDPRSQNSDVVDIRRPPCIRSTDREGHAFSRMHERRSSTQEDRPRCRIVPSHAIDVQRHGAGGEGEVHLYSAHRKIQRIPAEQDLIFVERRSKARIDILVVGIPSA